MTWRVLNPDIRRRELERRVAAGDQAAAEALLVDRRRAGDLRFSLDGVLETVRAMPGLTRREIAAWWGRGKNAGGSLLAELARVYLVHQDEAGRWWPGPDTRRIWDSRYSYGCYPVDALDDAGLTIPERWPRKGRINVRTALRSLRGVLGLLLWTESELRPHIDVVDQAWLADYVSDLRDLIGHLEAGGRWRAPQREAAQTLSGNLLAMYRRLNEVIPGDTWCGAPELQNPDEPLRRLERAVAAGDPGAGEAYLRYLERTGYMDLLWQRTLAGDHAAAQEARELRKTGGKPVKVPRPECYVVTPLESDPLWVVPHLDGKPISIPLSAFTHPHYDPVQVQIDYHLGEHARDPRWERAINREHYECPGCE